MDIGFFFFFWSFPGVFQESILKIAHPHACESEGYFTNHDDDNNAHSGHVAVMDV